jgi:RNA polymerase sigma-70 factor (ECF subfamily)
MLDDRAIKTLLPYRRDEGSPRPSAAFMSRAPLLLGVAHRVPARAGRKCCDAFARIWHAAGSFDPLAAQPVAWMTAIVRNRAIDVRSSHDVSRVDSYHAAVDEDPEGSLDRLFDWSPAADEGEDRRRAAQWLRDCLSKLAAPERQSLVLAYENGLSHSELAAHLKKPLAGRWRGCDAAWRGARMRRGSNGSAA